MVAGAVTGLAPVAGEAIGRRAGIFDLLSPLDYPRRALANAGSKIAALLSGEGDLGENLLGAAPAVLGGAAGLLTGNPILYGALAAGGLQGLGQMTGQEAFDAPSAQDVAGSLGVDSPLGSSVVGALTDPLTYAGLLPALRSAGGATQAKAAAMGLAGAPSEGALSGAEAAYGGLLAKSREAATLNEAQGVLGNASGNVDRYLAGSFPGGEMRFGSALDPNAPQSLQELLGFAADPRAAYVGYNPALQQNLPQLGESLTSGLRVGQQAAPEVMQALENTGQALLPPGPGGRTTIMGAAPDALDRGPGGWARLGGAGMPPAQPPLQMGALPPELLRPSPMPSLSELALGTQGGAPLANPALPPSLSPVGAGQVGTMRQNLAGIGQHATTGQFNNVVDLPLDEAVRALQMEQRATGSSLQQMLAQVRALTPEQIEALKRMYPGFTPGGLPAAPSGLFNTNPVL